MLPYPDINPIAFQIGPLKVYWYGLMYLVGFAGAWWLGTRRTRKPHVHWKPEQVSDLLFYVALGVIIGGRIGFVLFYNFWLEVHHPFYIFKIWDGGMSFHGGLLGVIVAMVVYARRQGRVLFDVADFVAPLVPIALFAGRIGNFINGELWGRITTLPWAWCSLAPDRCRATLRSSMRRCWKGWCCLRSLGGIRAGHDRA